MPVIVLRQLGFPHSTTKPRKTERFRDQIILHTCIFFSFFLSLTTLPLITSGELFHSSQSYELLVFLENIVCGVFLYFFIEFFRFDYMRKKMKGNKNDQNKY